ncbi:MAG: peptidylprolyl isomerase [Pirellulaceae bacterium]
MELLSRPLSFAALTLSLASLMFLAGCGGKDAGVASSGETSPEVTAASASTDATAKNASTAPVATINYESQPSIYDNAAAAPIVNPVVILHTSAGDIEIELFMEQAPQTVGNFLDNYARQGAYENTIFHYVDPKGFILGGGYTEDLTKKPTRGGINNESNNGVSHERGTVALSHEPSDPNSGACEFFINVVDNTGLNYQGKEPDQRGYCVFGRVTKGMEIVDQIAAAALGPKEGFDNLPAEAIVIQSVEEVK